LLLISIKLSSISSSELQHHVDRAPGLQAVVADLHLVSELLSSKDQSNLVNGDPLFLLERLLDLQNLNRLAPQGTYSIFGVEVEALLPAGEGLPMLFLEKLTFIKSCMIN